jgi:uncharacterized protein
LAVLQLVLLMRAISRRDWNTIHLGILLCSLTVFSVIPSPRRWRWVLFIPIILYLLIPILLYWALVQSIRPLRLTVAWLRVGRPTLSMWIAAATVAVVSAACLLLWSELARPDVRQAGLILTWSPGRLMLLGVGFALFNAAMEEMIWRGVVFHALERTGLPTVPVVLIQALSFGVFHLHGFPGGSVGILLASAYGAILGVLRSQTRGLLVPFVTHAATDFSLFEIFVYLAHD